MFGFEKQHQKSIDCDGEVGEQDEVIPQGVGTRKPNHEGVGVDGAQWENPGKWNEEVGGKVTAVRNAAIEK